MIFIEPIVISSALKFQIERLFRIRRETIFRQVIKGIKNLTALRVNVLLINTSSFQIARSDISTICAHPPSVYLYCLQQSTYLRQYNNTVYIHVHNYNSVCTNNWSFSCNCFYRYPPHNNKAHHNTAIKNHFSFVRRDTKTMCGRIASLLQKKKTRYVGWVRESTWVSPWTILRRSFHYLHRDKRKRLFYCLLYVLCLNFHKSCLSPAVCTAVLSNRNIMD